MVHVYIPLSCTRSNGRLDGGTSYWPYGQEYIALECLERETCAEFTVRLLALLRKKRLIGQMQSLQSCLFRLADRYSGRTLLDDRPLLRSFFLFDDTDASKPLEVLLQEKGPRRTLAIADDVSASDTLNNLSTPLLESDETTAGIGIADTADASSSARSCSHRLGSPHSAIAIASPSSRSLALDHSNPNSRRQSAMSASSDSWSPQDSRADNNNNTTTKTHTSSRRTSWAPADSSDAQRGSRVWPHHRTSHTHTCAVSDIFAAVSGVHVSRVDVDVDVAEGLGLMPAAGAGASSSSRRSSTSIDFLPEREVAEIQAHAMMVAGVPDSPPVLQDEAYGMPLSLPRFLFSFPHKILQTFY